MTTPEATAPAIYDPTVAYYYSTTKAAFLTALGTPGTFEQVCALRDEKREGTVWIVEGEDARVFYTSCRNCGGAERFGALNGRDECRGCSDRRLEAQRAIVAAQPAVEIKRGDTVAITVNGRVYRGVVSSAVNYGRELGWCVEFKHTKGSAARVGEPGYWKQWSDGGVIALA